MKKKGTHELKKKKTEKTKVLEKGYLKERREKKNNRWKNHKQKGKKTLKRR